jgi:deoxyribodipyrimidine photolyase-related protein
MIIANWCLLNEYAPKEVFNWFVEMYVDSADWVMVANVLGMGIFADGGIFATKPYLSGGNYIKKMSDYPNSNKWEPIWTEKFWNFLSKNKEYFKTNPRMNMLILAQDKKKASLTSK